MTCENESMEYVSDDDYIDVILKKQTFLIRSFALGGLPYFEKSGQYDETDKQIIDDICSGVYSDKVAVLFDGADIPKNKTVQANIFDSRKEPTKTYSQMLYPPNKEDRLVMVRARRISDPTK